MNIFKEFDAILAALTKNQYKKYWQSFNYDKESKPIQVTEKTLETAKNILEKHIRPIKDLKDLCYWCCNKKENILNQVISELENADRSTSTPDKIRYEKYKDLFDKFEPIVEKFSNYMQEIVKEAKKDPFTCNLDSVDLEEEKTFVINAVYSILQDLLGQTLDVYITFPFKEQKSSGYTRELSPNKYVKDLYKDLFGGKWRIVLPYTLDPNKSNTLVDVENEDIRYNISKIIDSILIYLECLGKTKEHDALMDEGHVDFDKIMQDILVDGKYSFYTMDRKISIGKIFEYLVKNVIDKNDPRKEKLPYKFFDVVTFFNQHRIPKERDFVIVISRHPYDIAGMSTGRGWTSCMNLDDGQYKDYVAASVVNGGLIAYFCYKNDTTDLVDSQGKHHKNSKINIQHPLGRVLIKTYYKKKDKKIDYENPNFILKCSKAYGVFLNDAIQKVQDWLNENWNDKVSNSGKIELYDLDDDTFYFEHEDPHGIEY